jgi:hypothetical protein
VLAGHTLLPISRHSAANEHANAPFRTWTARGDSVASAHGAHTPSPCRGSLPRLGGAGRSEAMGHNAAHHCVPEFFNFQFCLLFWKFE